MIDVTKQYESYPEFMKIVDIVSSQNPLQRKRIHAFISRQNRRYWTFAENLCKNLRYSFLQNDEEWREAARSYNQTCKEILHMQIRFQETGVYPTEDAQTANETVYSQENVMRYYIVGLLFSYLFWPNHYKMFSFFQDHLPTNAVATCLEVGVGHGLFTAEVLQRFPKAAVTCIDISETSLDLARKMLRTFQLNPASIQSIHGDYLITDLGAAQYDFIIMGEVLEHVDDAPGFLKRAYNLVRPGGTIFVSTCANCPSVDHVYHFHSVEEIRELIRDANLKIVTDLALPAEAIPEPEWAEKRVTLNYCGILKREP